MLMRDMATADGEIDRHRVFVANIRAALAVLLAVNGIVAVLAPWAMPLLFGEKFSAAIPATILFLGAGALKVHGRWSIKRCVQRITRKRD